MRFIHLVLISTVCSVVTGILGAFIHIRLLFLLSILLSIPGFTYLVFAISVFAVLIVIELLHKFRRVNHH